MTEQEAVEQARMAREGHAAGKAEVRRRTTEGARTPAARHPRRAVPVSKHKPGTGQKVKLADGSRF
jgi:hypothetical protein